MRDHRRLGVLGLCALSMAVLAGCGSGQPVAGIRAQAGGLRMPYTAQQLRAALLSKLDGAGPAVPVQAGRYGSLQGVGNTRAGTRGVRIIPARCALAARTGLDSAALADAPATMVSFRDGSAGVSEVLLAPSGSLAASVLSQAQPRSCRHYRAVVSGRTYTYTVRNEPAPRIGESARETNIHASGAASLEVWTIIYRANGYVGAITLVGPAATRQELESIAWRAYGTAQQKLS
jgi:hypothetical protein